MRKIIHNLRQKPEATKVRIIHLTVLVAGVLLVSAWLWSIGGIVTSPGTANVLDGATELSDALRPIDALKDNFVEGYKSSMPANVLEEIE